MCWELFLEMNSDSFYFLLQAWIISLIIDLLQWCWMVGNVRVRLHMLSQLFDELMHFQLLNRKIPIENAKRWGKHWVVEFSPCDFKLEKRNCMQYTHVENDCRNTALDTQAHIPIRVNTMNIWSWEKVEKTLAQKLTHGRHSATVCWSRMQAKGFILIFFHCKTLHSQKERQNKRPS